MVCRVFTLIELLIVLILVAVAGSLIWPLTKEAPDPAPDPRKVDLAALPASASPAADCQQAKDMRLRISGCTAYLASGKATKAQTAEARDLRGTAYAALTHLARARTDYDEALKLEPSFPRAYLNRGSLNEIEKKFAAAESDYRQAVALAQQRHRATPSNDLAQWIMVVQRSVERIESRREMERRWVAYLAQIQAQDDYANWSDRPHDLYQRYTAASP